MCKESFFISEILNIMYDDIFYAFFGIRNYKGEPTAEKQMRYRAMSRLLKKEKCPAENIIAKSLTIAQLAAQKECFSFEQCDRDEYSKVYQIVKKVLAQSFQIKFYELDYLFQESIKFREFIKQQREETFCYEDDYRNEFFKKHNANENEGYKELRCERCRDKDLCKNLDEREKAFIEECRVKILRLIDPESVLLNYLYMKYHKKYDSNLYSAFSDALRNSIGGFFEFRQSQSDDQYFLAFNVENIELDLEYADKLMYKVKSSVYDDKGKVSEDFLNETYKFVYHDFIAVEEKFPCFHEYSQPKEKLEEVIQSIFNDVKWNPKGSKSGAIYESTLSRYLGMLMVYVKQKVIIQLDTSSKRRGKNEPNLRTIRENSVKLKEIFTLETPYGQKSPYIFPVVTCPQFLLDDFWTELKKYGLRGYNDEKIKDKEDSLKNIIAKINMMGRLYMILPLTYIFDENNFLVSSQEIEFENLLKRSIGMKEIKDLLKAYSAITVNEKDRNIINELLKDEC